MSDADFTRERTRRWREWRYEVPSKEALSYYRLLRQHMPDDWIMPEIGTSRSI